MWDLTGTGIGQGHDQSPVLRVAQVSHDCANNELEGTRTTCIPGCDDFLDAESVYSLRMA